MERGEPIGPLTLHEAHRYRAALAKASWTAQAVRVNGAQVSKWFPPDYADLRLSKLLASTSPISLSLSEGNRYGRALKKAGWTRYQTRKNGASVNEWLPPDYADPRLSELLASTSPISLLRSEGKRYVPALEKAGWTSRQVRGSGTCWLPPDYADPRLSELLASTSPFSLSLSEGTRYGPALRKAGWAARQFSVNGERIRKWFPPDRP